jgi:hypothetical protein
VKRRPLSAAEVRARNLARVPTTHGSDKHSASYEAANANLQTHVTGTGSPHTAAGVGAEASGAVATHAALTTGVHGLGAMSQIADAASDGNTYGRKNGAWSVAGGGSTPPWYGKIYGCLGDGNPDWTLRGMLNNPIHATPTNIAITVARCSYFRAPAALTVNKIRWFGVGATTGLYHVAVYRVSDGARMAILDDFNTAAQTWGAGAFSCTLASGVLYLLAVSVDTTGTTAGVGCLSATAGRIGALPESWPGNLDIDLATPCINPLAFVQFAVSAGVLPATLPTRVLQAAWTGGMPAFFLDNNNA